MKKIMIIDDKQYQVSLLDTKEVMRDIFNRFISSDSDSTYFTTLSEEKRDNIIYEYIHHYEKISYQEEEFFIFKDDLPLVFHEKKHVPKTKLNDYDLLQNIFYMFCPVVSITMEAGYVFNNIKNKLTHRFKKILLKPLFTNAQVFLLFLLNIAFVIWMIKEQAYLSLFLVSGFSVFLSLNKQNFKQYYLHSESYKLPKYHFSEDQVFDKTYDKLQAIKVKSTPKEHVVFDFSEKNS